MKLLRVIGGQIVSLFLDDEFLAVATLIVISVTALLINAVAIPPLAAGGIPLGGSAGVLIMSIWRTMQIR